ncbi:response regulator [Anaerobacillus isosaccharinicus]|uniref:Response regulator n=1 Tax=Anaerobacillus isosaccharinicus TaxID=1532552 RepID=A0A1S2KWL2_9BACI|nr:response regulator [Anaerobacillus isosaccharinicus]MBA5584964.1 response regulator [Anaerobacillus isosaccharinicus]QOY36681.1 response regulator [Anaerobacillus isosaccharinicus]
MKTVLIADDSLFMRTLLGNKLKQYGFMIIAEAEDGIEAIDKFNRYRPDIVLLDITMPKKNGIFALDNIMQIDGNAKVIMCSAMGQQTIIVDAIKKGAKDFIVKPYFENIITILKNLD